MQHDIEQTRVSIYKKVSFVTIFCNNFLPAELFSNTHALPEVKYTFLFYVKLDYYRIIVINYLKRVYCIIKIYRISLLLTINQVSFPWDEITRTPTAIFVWERNQTFQDILLVLVQVVCLLINNGAADFKDDEVLYVPGSCYGNIQFYSLLFHFICSIYNP